MFTKISPIPWRVSSSGYSIKAADDAVVFEIPGGTKATKFEQFLENANYVVDIVNEHGWKERAEKAEAELAHQIALYRKDMLTCGDEINRLRRLEPYVDHEHGCAFWDGTGRCDCGLDAARKESGDV